MADPVTHTIGSVLSALQPIGAPPIGNPADLRAHAARLRAIADQLGPSQATLARAGKVTGAEGPGANSSRAALSHELQMLESRVHAIRTLAARLDSEAGSLEGSQQAWRYALQGRAAGLPGALVDQAIQRLGWSLP